MESYGTEKNGNSAGKEKNEENVLEIKNLSKKFVLDAVFFAKQDKFIYALNDVSFSIKKGKTYGLVGESGSGKTTTAKLLVKMYRADSGKILFRSAEQGGNPVDVMALSGADLKSYREKVKYVFQDPSRSLNPRMNVFQILTSGYRYSKKWPGKNTAMEECCQILEETGLDPKDLFRHPSEFSGGQRQRISIARGLLMKPDVLICDEVVSALDVSIQGQILNLLSELKSSRSLSFLFIAHDLRVSCYFCDTIGVMYRGILVEQGSAENFYKEAVHPYSKLLFEGSAGTASSSAGEAKSFLEYPEGCPFRHRCRFACEKCAESLPEWKEISDGHFVRCFNF